MAMQWGRDDFACTINKGLPLAFFLLTMPSKESKENRYFDYTVICFEQFGKLCVLWGLQIRALLGQHLLFYCPRPVIGQVVRDEWIAAAFINIQDGNSCQLIFLLSIPTNTWYFGLSMYNV